MKNNSLHIMMHMYRVNQLLCQQCKLKQFLGALSSYFGLLAGLLTELTS